MKSEPSSYSIEDLQDEQKTRWDGVRNFQARNFMMNEMNVGDEVLFYHSNAKPSGVVGIAEVSAEAIPDVTALNPRSEYFDPKSTRENPRWYCVEVQFKKKFPHIISLQDLRKNKSLQGMVLLQRGTRLSIQPVTASEFTAILKMNQI